MKIQQFKEKNNKKEVGNYNDIEYSEIIKIMFKLTKSTAVNVLVK